MRLPSDQLIIDTIIHETQSHGWTHQQSILTKPNLEAINTFFDEHRGSFAPAKVGKGAQKVRKEEIRGDYTFWIDPLDPPVAFVPLIELLERLKQNLNQALLLGIKEFECHLAYYPPGAFYKTHIDKFSQDSTRIYSFVFYLHQEWESGNGGELILYDRQGNTLKKISPLPGSMVGFISDDFPHEVCSAQVERRSFTGWMHSKIIN